MIRIGIDARLNYYRAGGIANYTRRLIEALADLDSTSDYRILHSRKAEATQSIVPGPNFRRESLWTPCHHRLERWALSAELARFQLDLLHCPDFIPPQWGAKKTVITVHDLNFLYYPEFLTQESRRFYNDQIIRATKQADHILADSEATKQDMITMIGVPPEKITVHMLGVEEAFHVLPDETVTAMRQALDLPTDYILFVGTFEPRKNITGLVDAYKLLRDQMPDAPPLVLAGRPGWLYEEIFAHVENTGLGSNVLWRENVPQNHLPALYNGASILAAPSFYEGFGLPALEAMACGTPTIVSNRGSLPEVVGDTGILIDPDDPTVLASGLYDLLNNTQTYNASKQAGLDRAKQFTWQNTAEMTLRVYQSLLNT